MRDSIKKKLEDMALRQKSIEKLLSDPAVLHDQEKFQQLSKEMYAITPIMDLFNEYSRLQSMIDDLTLLLTDEQMKELAEIELVDLRKKIIKQEQYLLQSLLPKDPDDQKNVYLEIRAGTGGDEASLFSGDLYRMYQLYAQEKKWRWQVIHSTPSDHGGYKEVICHITGKGVFEKLKYESGTHRVQRVPETESQGRIHTSACTVAILPEADTIDAVDILPQDLRIDTFRSSGAGGQHVNTTDSAVRITHIPTSTVVECQDERSQHKNKARAMSLLQAKILANTRSEAEKERSESRKLQVGSGDRSERIRTYNFPQGRVSDHRISLTLYKLDMILSGDLDLLIEPLTQEDQADKMSSMGDV